MREEAVEYVMPPSTSELLKHALRPIHRKLDLIINALGETMADVSGLNTAIDELDADEVAAVAEFKALSEEIAGLTTERAPTQEEIDSITSKVTAAAEALKAGTPSGTTTPPTETTPPAETTPPPAEETLAPPAETVPPVEAPGTESGIGKEGGDETSPVGSPPDVPAA